MSNIDLEQLDQLEKFGYYHSVPHGISMKPMIPNKEGIVEIHKLEGPAKRYDLVMYVRNEKQGVVHRVVKVREDDYIIIGDNCWQFEYVKKDTVHGIVKKFYRHGKWYDVDNKWYRLYVHIWTDFLFIRRPIFYVRDHLKHFFKTGKLRRYS